MDALMFALLEPFQVEHQVLVMIDMESADRKETSFLLNDQEVKNSGHELSRVVNCEENYHMVAEKRSLRW